MDVKFSRTGLIVSGFVALVGLAGCAGSEPRPDLQRIALADKAAADLGLARADILESGECHYARVPPGVRETSFYACWYVATAGTIHVMDWNAGRNQFFDALRLDASGTTAVAVASAALATGQLQLRGPNTWVVLAIGNGMAHEIHDRFVRAGVPEGASPGWVGGSVRGPTTVTIPIYIPAHR